MTKTASDPIATVLARELDSLDPQRIRASAAFTLHLYTSGGIDTSFWKDVDPRLPIRDIILYCRHEVYRFLCEDCDHYTDERAAVATLKKFFIGFVAGLLTAKYGLAEANRRRTCRVMPPPASKDGCSWMVRCMSGGPPESS